MRIFQARFFGRSRAFLQEKIPGYEIILAKQPSLYHIIFLRSYIFVLICFVVCYSLEQ